MVFKDDKTLRYWYLFGTSYDTAGQKRILEAMSLCLQSSHGCRSTGKFDVSLNVEFVTCHLFPQMYCTRHNGIKCGIDRLELGSTADNQEY